MLVEPLTDVPTRIAFKKAVLVRTLDGRTSLRSNSMMFWGKVRPRLPDQENSRAPSRSRPRAYDRTRRGCRSKRYSNIIVNAEFWMNVTAALPVRKDCSERTSLASVKINLNQGRSDHHENIFQCR
jgi:hypothetical protein